MPAKIRKYLRIVLKLLLIFLIVADSASVSSKTEC